MLQYCALGFEGPTIKFLFLSLKFQLFGVGGTLYHENYLAFGVMFFDALSLHKGLR